MSDLISRQAAIEALHTILMYRMGTDSNKKRLDDWINSLPPIQPKRGRWIKLDMHRGMADHKCTACKQECYVPTCMGEPMYAFCPNCGADMRERKERTVRAIDADALQRAIVEEGQANKRKKYIIGDIWELTGAEIRDVINSQPTIQPEPHWIPVTEPPTDRMICYVTLKDTNDENRQNWVAEMIYTPWDGFDLMDGIEAIAWMPKKYPEPYKGVTE